MSTFNHALFDSLIEDLSRRSIEDRLDLQASMQEISSVFDCELVQFFSVNTKSNQTLDAVITGREDDQNYYAKNFQLIDPRFHRVKNWKLPTWRNSNLLTETELKRSELGSFFRDVKGTNQLGSSTIQGDIQFLLTIIRSEAEGEFEKTYEAPLLRLNRTLISISNRKAENLVPTNEFNAYESNAIYLDTRGKIIHLGRSAEKVFTEGWVDAPNGLLRAGIDVDQAKLDKLIAHSIRQRIGDSHPQTIVLRDYTGRIGGSVTAYTIGMQHNLNFLGHQPALVLILKSVKTNALDSATVATELGLTQSEAELVCDITNGTSLAEHAASKRIAVMTVRGTLKGVFAKLNISKQSDLVRLVQVLWDVPN